MLILGGFVFSGFEIPEKITFGGKQTLITHRLPGGRRVVDAMGTDDRDLEWSGCFTGTLATLRARQLDTMRRQGRPLELLWHSYAYRVVISSFEADFERFYDIPYRICCVVVLDRSARIFEAITGTIDQVIGEALSGASGAIGGFAGGAAAAASLAGMASQVVTATPLRDAGPAALGLLSTYALGQVTSLGERLLGLDTTLSGATVGGVTGGGTDLAAGVATQASAMDDAYASVRVRGELQRLALNVQGAS
jgi:hypothetical protein